MGRVRTRARSVEPHPRTFTLFTNIRLLFSENLKIRSILLKRGAINKESISLLLCFLSSCVFIQHFYEKQLIFYFPIDIVVVSLQIRNAILLLYLLQEITYAESKWRNGLSKIHFIMFDEEL